MGRVIAEERLSLAEACLDDGWSYRQITLTHGISGPTLRRHFPGRGMDLREAAKLGWATRKANEVVSMRTTTR